MNEQLMEEVVSAENWHAAWKAVEANGGAAGIDGMGSGELKEHLRRHGEALRAKLLVGRYAPNPVKRVIIPKPGGGERLLGIPTVVDRFVQQMLLQALTPLYEPRFSARSYGFRPGRSAHDAVRQAQAYVREGKSYVVDLDIEKFFDQVHHDVLMSRLREVVGDVRVRALIGRYLKAGVMINGVVQEVEEGTPQGGPLSPLLANIYLDPLDRELEQRGLSHVRYADDCNIYVGSATSAQRVYESVSRWIEKHLRLRINRSKSGSGPTAERKFLGFTLNAQGQVEIARKTIERFKERVRELWEGRQSLNNEQLREQWNRYVRGWSGYFRLTDRPRDVSRLEGWIRRHIRKFYWLRWHNAAGRTAALKRLGTKAHYWPSARSARGAWRMAASAAMQAALSKARLRQYHYLMPSDLLLVR
jgi:group II intron reverse transcriptase/maturase